ncbi:MAG TPA: hypothetical protein VGF45_17135 [Polyangia bacterium]
MCRSRTVEGILIIALVAACGGAARKPSLEDVLNDAAAALATGERTLVGRKHVAGFSERAVLSKARTTKNDGFGLAADRRVEIPFFEFLP